MNQKRLLSFFLVTAVFLAPVLCPAQGLPNGVQKVTSAEGITEYSLNNGLHFLVFPDPSKPTITVNVTYLVGSRQEGSGEGGMAHLLEPSTSLTWSARGRKAPARAAWRTCSSTWCSRAAPTTGTSCRSSPSTAAGPTAAPPSIARITSKHFRPAMKT